MNKLGRWITNNTTSPFYCRKTIAVREQLEVATAKVCGLGQFQFYINGKKVGDHELDPGWTNYNKYIQYVVFDITQYLQEGKNVIGAEVGNGWFIKQDEHYTFTFPSFMPPNPNPYKPFGESLVFAVTIELQYKDGTMEQVTADETFLTKPHPVVMSNVFGSETIDGRLAVNGWNTLECNESDWEPAIKVLSENEPKGELQEQFQPPIRIIHTYEGNYLGQVEKRHIYDLGQNIAGILEFEVKGKIGEIVKLYPAEKLKETGDVDQMAKAWTEVNTCITYIIRQEDVWETCRMKFTYFAGRYIAAEGGEIRNLKGNAISSAYKRTGTFSCDDERYEKIYDLVEKAVEANMLSVHTDCPTIERFAWQEPNHLMAPSIMYMKDGRELWKKFLLDMRVDQHTQSDSFLDFAGKIVRFGEGMMPAQCPCYIPNVLPVPGMGSFYDIIPWGSTCILGTYWHYMFYGDQQIIRDNYEAGVRYLNYLKTKVNEDGFLNHGLGDWGNPENEYARENIETVFLYADAIILAKFARILDRFTEEEALKQYAAQVKENYNHKLLVKHPENNFYCYKVWEHQEDILLTQASQALPLYWGMVPEEYLGDVVKAFEFTMEQKAAFICGEVGLPYVIQCARMYGMNDLVARYILREEHPGYYAFVLEGETTLGEYWESNPRSHCHDMMGHIIEWYYNGIAGIISEEPGFQSVTICPYLPKSITRFTCSYESAAGRISVSVEETTECIWLFVEIPDTVGRVIDTKQLERRGKRVVVKIKEE